MTRIVKGFCFARETHAPRSSGAIKPSATGARRVIFAAATGSQIPISRDSISAMDRDIVEGKKGGAIIEGVTRVSWQDGEARNCRVRVKFLLAFFFRHNILTRGKKVKKLYLRMRIEQR